MLLLVVETKLMSLTPFVSLSIKKCTEVRKTEILDSSQLKICRWWRKDPGSIGRIKPSYMVTFDYSVFTARSTKNQRSREAGQFHLGSLRQD